MKDWKFLDNIDFKNHDGVALPIINDFMRNQFYDCILLGKVRNQRCMDIGFGTGLLSLLALKHGASSILAYESDLDRYHLGSQIIQLLKLQDQITLLNERYTHDRGLDKIDVIITETVDGNLWYEGLYKSFPRHIGKMFLPGQYFLEIHAVPISTSFARGLMQYQTDCDQFAPGIDLHEHFVACINLMLAKKYIQPIKSQNKVDIAPGIHMVEMSHTVWGQNAYARAIQNGSCVAKYTLDANTLHITTETVDTPIVIKPIDFDCRQHELVINTRQWQNQTVLIVPRAGMQHHTSKLYLDTGHWGTTKYPIILHYPQKPLTVTHRFTSGAINYN